MANKTIGKQLLDFLKIMCLHITITFKKYKMNNGYYDSKNSASLITGIKAMVIFFKKNLKNQNLKWSQHGYILVYAV